ncbi:MAG: restriction endonuclease [Candidatus Poribacteria bacterium]|nr:restriction endonuclease [Candidatus Poribacteria bacterium]
METAIKTAFDPDTNQEYEIELPVPEIVKTTILELDFPSDGLMNREIASAVAKKFQLSEKQENAQNNSQVNRGSKDTIWRDNMILPILQELKKEGKLEQPLGSGNPYVLNSCVSQQLYTKSNTNSDPDSSPEQLIETSYKKISEELVTELIDKIKNNTPAFFENLVIDLLVAMDYGGSQEDAEAVGRSGDGGIDGIINEDRLGLDVVYVQAKRWEANVGEPPIRDFAGALDGRGAQKGIFITTSDFSPSARQFADRSTKKIVLINGKRLAELMIEHNVGVSTKDVYEIKRVDSDYFAEK